MNQIGSSMMCVVWDRNDEVSLEIETFNLTETGPVSWKKFDINDNIESTYWRARIFEKSGKSFLMMITGSKKYKEEFVFIYDILSGVKVFEHKSEFRHDIYDFNWDKFEECAMLSIDYFPVDDYPMFPEDIYYNEGDNDPRMKFLSIRIENVCYKSKSLKNQARLACLKSLDTTYLNENLPDSLKRYIGISE